MDARPGTAKDNDVAAAQVQKDVRVILNALYAGDLETPLRFMHPRAVELIGGMDVLRPAVEIAARRFKELDMQLELLTFPQPPQFFDGEGRRFATVPTLLIISFKGGDRVESLNFQFGILENGASDWKYIDGSQMNAQIGRLMFPSFPGDIKFPQISQRKLPRN